MAKRPARDRINALREKVDNETRGNRANVNAKGEYRRTRTKPHQNPKLVDKNGKHASGGWRGNPNSLVALAANRTRTQFGSPHRKTCKGCGGPPVYGMDVCRQHGGLFALHLRKQRDPGFKPRRSAVIRTGFRRLLAAGAIPNDLLKQPIFADIATLVVGGADGKRRDAGLPRNEKTRHTEAKKEWEAACDSGMDLLAGWFRILDDNDFRVWNEAVTKARQRGLVPGS